jgi:uncharacterized membrane protein
MEFWVVILTFWAFYRWIASRIQRQKDDERFARVVEALNRLEPRLKDIGKLESRFQELEQRLSSSPAPGNAEQHPPPQSAPVPTPAEPLPTPDLPPAPEMPNAVATTDEAHAPKLPVPPFPAPPPPEPPAPPPAPPLRLPASSRPERAPFSSLAKPTSASSRELGSQLEQTLGANWLNKLGIIALVIGISLFLAYKFPSLSNPQKILLCYTVSFLILGTGVYLERLDRYRVFARALIGGGWALTFFVTYAMHFVPYTRVIDTQSVDLVLLFVVAAVMVGHTLRYDSQVVTGLAFLLAFTTVAISQNTIYSLSAGAILALGLVAIVHRRQWFELEVFGILASYGNHFLWLANVIVPAAGGHRIFPEFVPSTVLLCLYWATYRWSYLARRMQNPAQENVSTLAAILNTSLLVALFKYQSVRPELAYYALLLLGVVELALGQLSVTRQRRMAFTILSTMGIILLIAAIPFKYSGMDTAIIWLAEAQMLLLAGVFSREILFRRFGLLVALLTSGDMLLNQALTTLYARLSQPPPDLFDRYTLHAPATPLAAMTFLAAGLLFYGNSLVIPRRCKDLFTSESEEISFRALSYLAALMLFTSVWLAFPNDWTGVIWGVLAVLLAICGSRANFEDLSWQAQLLVLAGFLRTLIFSFDAAQQWQHFTVRFLTFTAMAALLYLCAYFSGTRDSDFARVLAALDTWAGSILIAVLAFKEVSSPWIAVAWSIFALLLLSIGVRLQRIQLHIQAYLLSLSALVQIISVNLDAAAPFRLMPRLSLRFVTLAIVAAVFYLCAFWAAKGAFRLAAFAGAAYAWAASGLVVLLIYFEAASHAVALGWALFALILFEFGVLRKIRNLRAQGYVLFVLSFLRILYANLQATQQQLVLFTLPVAFLFYYMYLRLTATQTSQRSGALASEAASARVDPLAFDRKIHAASVLAYLGSATLVFAADSYFPGGAHLVAWALLCLLFIGIAWRTQRDIFLHHSVIVAFLVFFGALVYELGIGGPGRTDSFSKALYVSAVAAILFAAQAFAFPLRQRFASRAKSNAFDDLKMDAAEYFHRPEQVYFFLPFLLVTLLILNEVSFGRVTIAWGLEAVAAFLFALIVRERSFRLAALGLLLLCIAKIGLLDVWSIQGSDRYVTLIILGVALLLVSYLYTRYSEAIRRYL